MLKSRECGLLSSATVNLLDTGNLLEDTFGCLGAISLDFVALASFEMTVLRPDDGPLVDKKLGSRPTWSILVP